MQSSSVLSRTVGAAIFIVVAMFVWHSFGGGQSSAQAGTWYHGADGYEQALAQQKSSGQPILLYFHTEWCGYCKRLERDVLSTPAFEQRYGSLLKVKVNPESSSAEHKLAKDYAISGFPTIFIVSAGTPGEPIVGYGGADEFYSRLQQAARN